MFIPASIQPLIHAFTHMFVHILIYSIIHCFMMQVLQHLVA